MPERKVCQGTGEKASLDSAQISFAEVTCQGLRVGRGSGEGVCLKHSPVC